MPPATPSVRAPDFARIVSEHAASNPSALAVTYVTEPRVPTEVTNLSYRDFDFTARQVAAALKRVCQPGDRALLLFPAGTDFAGAFLGCLYAGIVAVPAPLPGGYMSQRHRVSAIAADAEPSVIFTTEAVRSEVDAFIKASGLNHVQLLVMPLSDEAPLEAPCPGNADSLALLQYTSGSTGHPKGVMLTNANLSQNAATLVATFGMTARTKLGSWIPHYHDMCLAGLMLPAWYAGSSATTMSPIAFIKRPVTWLQLVDKHDLDWSAGPNFAYDLCTRMVTDEQLADLDLSGWRYASNGSEPVQASTLTRFAERFAPAGLRLSAINPVYGLAEATAFVAGTGGRPPVIRHTAEATPAQSRRPDDREAELGPSTRDLVSSGSVRNLDALIVDPDSCEVRPEGQIGELWLRGASIGSGYWRNVPETERVFNGTTADGRSGYLRTGDLGVLEGSELFITGRIKDVIIVRGRNVYPHDIEHLIRDEIPDLRGLFGAAFGVPGVDGVERVALIHEVRPSVEACRLEGIGAEIRRIVAREVGVTVSGLQLVRRGTVERTTSGKIRRSVARQAFMAGQTAALWSSLDASIEPGPRAVA